jgi:hypothetical protein
MEWGFGVLPNIASEDYWKECNSVGNRGGTQEPQWPRAERARLRAPDWHRGRACVAVQTPLHCRKCPGLGSTVSRVAEAHSLESFAW